MNGLCSFSCKVSTMFTSRRILHHSRDTCVSAKFTIIGRSRRVHQMLSLEAKCAGSGILHYARVRYNRNFERTLCRLVLPTQAQLISREKPNLNINKHVTTLSAVKNETPKKWKQLEFQKPLDEIKIIESAKTNNQSEEEPDSVVVNWADGTQSIYPFIYLRDCCTCEECYHPHAHQRLGDIIPLMDVNIDSLIKPGKITFSKDHQSILMTWDDGHQSLFTADWLWERRLPTSNILETKMKKTSSKLLWGSEINGAFPEVSYQCFLDCDESLYYFLNCLRTVGVTILRDAPTRPNVLHDCAARLQTHIRRTHYGEIFTVKSVPEPNSLAYTSTTIPMHVDLAYYKYQPEVQVLHCIEQSADTQGGFSTLADGFYIAERLRKHQPEIFKLLSSQKFIFRDIGKDIYGSFIKQLARPIIEVDEDGEVCRVAFNHFTRSTFFDIPADDVQLAYRGYYHWEKELRNPEICVKFKLSPGDILCFDNTRLLHGRTGFDPTISSRWIEGCYYDWDELDSAFAVTEERLKSK